MYHNSKKLFSRGLCALVNATVNTYALHFQNSISMMTGNVKVQWKAPFY